MDVSRLTPGAPYPGRTTGVSLKVDQAGNLRVEDTNQLVNAPQDLVDRILENPYGRARRTSAGHVIVRVDDASKKAPSWRYVGLLDLPEPAPQSHFELRLASRAGRRVITRKTAGGGEAYATGPDATVKGLLAWAERVSAARGAKLVRSIFWDGGAVYWTEVAGKRIDFDGAAAPLEF